MNKRAMIGAGALLHIGFIVVACGGGTVETGPDDDAGDLPHRCGPQQRDNGQCDGGFSSGSSGVSSGSSSGGSSGASSGSSSGGSSGVSSGSSSGGSSGASSGRVPQNHRPTAPPCDDVRPSEGPNGAEGTCTTHADCTEGRNGRCVDARQGPTCTYDACLVDNDCAGGGVCECEGAAGSDANVCLGNVGCRVDAECGAGGFCSPSQGSCGRYLGIVTYQCHTPEDECIDDADCPENNTCRFDDTAAHWKCSNSECAG